MLRSTTQRGELDETATLRTLNSFAVDLISIPNVDDLFWYVAQNVVGQLKFVDCVIYEANPAQTMLVQVAALGEKNPYGRSILNPLNIPFGQGITGKVAQTGEAIVVDDLQTEDDYIEDTKRARSEICVPIVCGNRVVGVIDSEHPEAAAFGPAEMEVLITIAAMTGAKLELLAEAERSDQRYHDLVAAHAELSLQTTNRKALEAELFNARKLEAVGRLTGRFAHEFNNLLTVVSGNLELVNEAIGDVPFADSVKDAQTAAQRGAELIRSMLAYSQRTQLAPEVIDLNAVVTAGITQADRVALSLADDLNMISVDPKVLKTVLENLKSNARDAMSADGIVRISTQNITHKASDKRFFATPLPAGEYVRLNVCDTGIGIAPENLQQIFDPFYTTKPAGSGTGLGLSLTLGFMQQSGGTVAVQSVADKETEVQLYFPAFASDDKDLLTINR